MNKLVVIGEALIDFVAIDKGVSLKDNSGFMKVAGGAPANVAGAYAKLGGKSLVLTQLGADAFGDYILDVLNQNGIDTQYIHQSKEFDTSLAFVSVKDNGERDFKFYRKTAADLNYSKDHIPQDIFNKAKVMHFCSVDLVPSKMKESHEFLINKAIDEHICISFDPNLRFNLWDDLNKLKKTVNSFIPYAHILKISDEELEFITDCNDINESLNKLFVGNVELIIVTQASMGATLYLKNGQQITVNGLSVCVKDTTGAGDSFIGAFLYYIFNELEQIDLSGLKIALEFANAYAACTTTKLGALSSMANRNEFNQFINTHLTKGMK